MTAYFVKCTRCKLASYALAHGSACPYCQSTLPAGPLSQRPEIRQAAKFGEQVYMAFLPQHTLNAKRLGVPRA